MNRLTWGAVAGTTLVLALSACATGPTIRSDYDQNTDFSQYSTFRIMTSEEANEPRSYDTLTDQRIRAAIVRELTARGYRQVEEDADLLANFAVATKEVQEVQRAPSSYPPGWYAWRGSYYHPWPAYTYETYITSYTRGTLYIDLVDADRRQLVWEGEAEGRVTEKARQDPEPAINNAIAEIFARFPFRAGSDAEQSPAAD
jgi:hypothetical protein